MGNLLSQTASQKSREDGMILDLSEDTNSPRVLIDPKLTQRLKPHQQDGVRFMWDSCFESINHLQKDPGNGCILAHCMGLGKTFQVNTYYFCFCLDKYHFTIYIYLICLYLLSKADPTSINVYIVH